MELMVSGAVATTTSGPSVSEPKSGYASTYYPGTANVGEAQRISLAPGQESSSADFALVPVRLARVSGIVIGSDGKPLEGASVSALPLNRELSGMLMQQTARSAKDGSFTLSNVAPGDYTLQARSIQVFTSSQGDNVMVFRATAMAGGDSESGSTPLSIGGEDTDRRRADDQQGRNRDGTHHVRRPAARVSDLDPHLGGSGRPNRWTGSRWRLDDEGGRIVRDQGRQRHAADSREQRAAGMDVEIGQAEWHRHHRHRRRLQARRDHGRPRDRAHQQVNGRQRRRPRPRTERS